MGLEQSVIQYASFEDVKKLLKKLHTYKYTTFY